MAREQDNNEWVDITPINWDGRPCPQRLRVREHGDQAYEIAATADSLMGDPALLLATMPTPLVFVGALLPLATDNPLVWFLFVPFGISYGAALVFAGWLWRGETKVRVDTDTLTTEARLGPLRWRWRVQRKNIEAIAIEPGRNRLLRVVEAGNPKTVLFARAEVVLRAAEWLEITLGVPLRAPAPGPSGAPALDSLEGGWEPVPEGGVNQEHIWALWKRDNSGQIEIATVEERLNFRPLRLILLVTGVSAYMWLAFTLALWLDDDAGMEMLIPFLLIGVVAVLVGPGLSILCASFLAWEQRAKQAPHKRLVITSVTPKHIRHRGKRIRRHKVYGIRLEESGIALLNSWCLDQQNFVSVCLQRWWKSRLAMSPTAPETAQTLAQALGEMTGLPTEID